MTSPPLVVLQGGPGVNEAEAPSERTVRAAMDGVAAAQREIWQRFAPMAARMIRRTLGPGVDPEDLTQEVFAQVFRDLRRLREPTAIRSFIGSVTMNQLKMELRRRKLRSIVGLTSSGEMPDAAVRPVADDLAGIAVSRLLKIVDRFGSTDRLLFMLRYLEGLSVAETAVFLRVSEKTVKRRAAYVLERLSRLMRRDPVLEDYVVAQVRGGE